MTATRPAELDDPAFALRYLAGIGHAFTREGKVWKGICPFHGDTDPSLALYPDGGFNCFGCAWAGSILDYVIERTGGNRDDKADQHRAFVTLGLSTAGRPFTLPPLPAHFATPPSTEPPPPERAPDRVHPWHNHAGAVVMTKRRWYLTADERPRYRGKDKVIRPYLPDGRMGEPKDADLALYGWPALAAAAQPGIVYVVESESDADAVNAAGGLCVATGGASRWYPTWGPDLAGWALVLLPHQDEAGQTWAEAVIRQTRAHAATIRRLGLPGLPEHGDVRDFLAAHTLDALEVLAAFVPVLTADSPAICGELREMLDQVTAERDTLNQWKANACAILNSADLDPCDKVGLLQLQQLYDAGAVPRDARDEVLQKGWAEAHGTPASTWSRWMARWQALGLIDYEVVDDLTRPKLDTQGRPRLDKQNRPVYYSKTLACGKVAPFDLVTARVALTSPTMPGKRQNRRGGSEAGRICRNPDCGATEEQTDFQGLQCGACGTVYQVADPDVAYQRRPLPEWFAETAAPAPHFETRSAVGTVGAAPLSHIETVAKLSPATMAQGARAVGPTGGAPSLRIAGDAARELHARHAAPRDGLVLADGIGPVCKDCREPRPCLCDVAGRDGPVTRAAPALVGAYP